MANREKQDMTAELAEGKILPLVFKLTIPAVIAQLITFLYNIVDRMYVARIEGSGMDALAALGIVLPITLIMQAFANLVGLGGAPRAGIKLGEGKVDEANRIFHTAFCLLVLLGVVIGAAAFCFARQIVLLFGCPESAVEFAVSYLKIYACGTIFVMLAQGLNPFILTQGYSWLAMSSVLLGALINIALDPLFIFGLHMGVRGAALATVISQSVSCAWVLRFLTGKKTLLRLKKETLFRNFKLVLPCIALGSAAFIMQSSESVISVCFNSSLLKYGGDVAVGAMTILTSVMQFAMLPLQGIAQGAQPITSYNYGARNTARVRETFRKLLIACLTYSVLLWGFIQLFPGAFASMFTTDAELLAFTTRALRIYCGALFIFGLQIACQMTFVSIGNAGCSIVVAVLRKFVLLIPLIYILPAFLPDKTTAVYLAEPVADAIAVTCTAFLFAWQFKKALRKLEQPASVQEKET